MNTPHWLANLGLENPSIDEFLRRPDCRQIASFFLGILFATCSYFFIRSPTFVSISNRLFKRKTRPFSHTESALGTIDKTPSSLESTNNHLDPLALIFILDLVYITTSATRFASLLAFSSRAGTVACTFLVAWGTLGAQTVRLIAILRMSLHLRELGATKWESYALWTALGVTSIVMFLTAAVNTGVLRPIPQIQSFSLCYTKHFLLGAAVMAGMNIIMELYILMRVMALILPWFLAFKSKMKAMKDVRVFRAASLLILDGATIYPSLFPTSLVADFVPFSVASVLVLVAFNYFPASPQSLMASFIDPHPPSLPLSIRIPTPEFSPHLHISAPMTSPSIKAMSRLDISAPENISLRSVHSRISIPRRKPTPIEVLRDTPPFARELQGHSRPQSSQTWATGSLTDSVRGAVVGIARRARVVPLLTEKSRRRSDSTGTLENEAGGLIRAGTRRKRERTASGTASSSVPAIGSHFRWAAERSSAPSQLSEVSEPQTDSPKTAELIGRKIASQTHTVPSPKLIKPSKPSSRDSLSGPASPPLPRSPQNIQPSNRGHESFIQMTESSREESSKRRVLRRDSSGGAFKRGNQPSRHSDSLPEQYARTSYTASSTNFPESSRHSVVTSNLEDQQPRSGEGLRSRPADDLTIRTNELSIVHETSISHRTTPRKEGRDEDREEDESPTRPTLSSLNRPTFGSTSFEAFRSSYPLPSEGAPLSSTTYDSGSGSPTSPGEYVSRQEFARLPRSSFGSRLKSSGTDGSSEKGKISAGSPPPPPHARPPT